MRGLHVYMVRLYATESGLWKLTESRSQPFYGMSRLRKRLNLTRLILKIQDILKKKKKKKKKNEKKRKEKKNAIQFCRRTIHW